MSTDPYEVLGIERNATAEDIRKAYRELAKKYHPDLNPGNKVAEEKFKSLGQAHAILSDPEMRARYDRGEIDAVGHERGFSHASYRDFAEGKQGYRYGPGDEQFSAQNFGDIFRDIFGRGAGDFQDGAIKGQDIRYRLSINFVDAVNGATSRVTLKDGTTLDVRIPPGVEEGQILRLRGKGQSGFQNGTPGDALIEIHIEEDPRFHRDGLDIRMASEISLAIAVLGGKVTVLTPGGVVDLSVPPHSDTGTILRLKGRGIKASGKNEGGNLYVELKVKIGLVDQRLEQVLKDITTRN